MQPYNETRKHWWVLGEILKAIWMKYDDLIEIIQHQGHFLLTTTTILEVEVEDESCDCKVKYSPKYESSILL